jgi:hypothetical protein
MSQHRPTPVSTAGQPTALYRKLGYSALVLALLAVAVYLATYAAVPQRLPGVALGSRELLIAERAAAMFAILFVVALVLVRAVQGELPQELSGRGVKYARSDAVDELRDRLDTQFEAYDNSLEELEEAQAQLHGRMAALEEREPDVDSG